MSQFFKSGCPVNAATSPGGLVRSIEENSVLGVHTRLSQQSLACTAWSGDRDYEGPVAFILPLVLAANQGLMR